MPTAVFLVTFFALAVFLIAGFNEMLTRAEQNQGGQLPDSAAQQLAADLLLTLYSPAVQAANGTNLNSAHGDDFQTLASFQLSGQTDIHCMIARNWTKNFFNNFGDIYAGTDAATVLRRSSHNDNPGFAPSDFLLFWQTWMGGTLALERRYRYEIVTFPELAGSHGANYDTGDNFTVVQLHMRYWATGLVEWTRSVVPGPFMDSQLWNNHFNISVATGYNATYGSISPGTIIGQLITLKFADKLGIPTYVMALIMIPVTITIILVLVMVVTYFIP